MLFYGTKSVLTNLHSYTYDNILWRLFLRAFAIMSKDILPSPAKENNQVSKSMSEALHHILRTTVLFIVFYFYSIHCTYAALLPVQVYNSFLLAKFDNLFALRRNFSTCNFHVLAKVYSDIFTKCVDPIIEFPQSKTLHKTYIYKVVLQLRYHRENCTRYSFGQITHIAYSYVNEFSLSALEVA